MAKTGLITVLYKSDNVLEGFYKSLSIQDFNEYILYIVDNSPTPETVALLEKLSLQYPLTGQVKYIPNNINAGVARGNNQGIIAAMEDDCAYTILLNNDIEFHQNDLLSAMIGKAVAGGEHFIIPKIYFADGQTIWMAGGRFDRWRALTPHFGEGEPDNGQFDQPGYIEYAPTCFMLISREALKKTGLMDENYFVYYDDSDFIYRSIKKGYRIWYMPSLTINHKVGNSSGGLSPTYIYYYNRNRIYFIIKNLELGYMLSALFFYAGSRLLSFFRLRKDLRSKQWKGIKDGVRLCFKNRAVPSLPHSTG